jgi:hypothetical protein
MTGDHRLRRRPWATERQQVLIGESGAALLSVFPFEDKLLNREI